MHNRFAIAPFILRNKQRSSQNPGAAEESRTLDLNLGKVALYQLSYCRKFLEARAGVEPTYTDLQSGA